MIVNSISPTYLKVEIKPNIPNSSDKLLERKYSHKAVMKGFTDENGDEIEVCYFNNNKENKPDNKDVYTEEEIIQEYLVKHNKLLVINKDGLFSLVMMGICLIGLVSLIIPIVLGK